MFRINFNKKEKVDKRCPHGCMFACNECADNLKNIIEYNVREELKKHKEIAFDVFKNEIEYPGFATCELEEKTKIFEFLNDGYQEAEKSNLIYKILVKDSIRSVKNFLYSS